MSNQKLRDEIIEGSGKTIAALENMQSEIAKSRENIENGIIDKAEILKLYDKYHGVLNIMKVIEQTNMETAIKP